MAAKLFSVLLIAAVVSQGYAFTLNEIRLDDENVNFISHPFYSRSITIPKWWFDTLLTCHVVYPNGITYEVFPTNRLPDDEIVYMPANSAFRSCSVAFVHSERIEQYSGTYELRSLVQHQDESMTLASQRFIVSITASEVGIPQ